jgi:hypothetical protein
MERYWTRNSGTRGIMMPKYNIWNYMTEEEMLNDYEYFIGLLKEEIEQLKEENKRLKERSN